MLIPEQGEGLTTRRLLALIAVFGFLALVAWKG